MNRYSPKAPANDNVVFSLAFTYGLDIAKVRKLRKTHSTCEALNAACKVAAKA